MATRHPKYQLIADHYAAQIRRGELKPGDKLPSLAELQESWNCSYGTVRGSQLQLKALGLVEGVHGEGVYVCDTRQRADRRTLADRIVDAMPPLTPQQRQRLQALLDGEW